MDNITTPHFIETPPEGRGVIQEGVEGGPPIVGGIYIFLYGTPPMLPQLSICLSMYLSLIQIYVLYFTMSNYKGIKKGITFVRPTNESRSVIPFCFRKKYVPFRLDTLSSYRLDIHTQCKDSDFSFTFLSPVGGEGDRGICNLLYQTTIEQ